MKFYLIRLKQRPDLYVGRESSTYAISSDRQIKDTISLHNNRYKEEVEVLVQGYSSDPPYWFREQLKAKIFTTPTEVRKLVRRYSEKDDTFSQYEVEIHEDEKKVVIQNLDDFMKQKH
jgi:hypothetical protein